MVLEHNIKGVLDFVDRAYILDKGRVVFTGTSNAIRDSDIPTEFSLGKSGK